MRISRMLGYYYAIYVYVVLHHFIQLELMEKIVSFRHLHKLLHIYSSCKRASLGCICELLSVA
jgi:hypothetical protein